MAFLKNIQNTTNPDKNNHLNGALRKLQLEMMLHKKKAQWFYTIKKSARLKSMKTVEYEAVTMDYGRNLPLPNISTNDVYYKRQLSFYSFNIHVLSSAESYFYTYDQTVANKGSEDVVSMLNHFITNHLDKRVKHFELFCDSCSGQNKNFNLIRYLHYITVTQKVFESVTITFPVRGHSYMENDKNMGLINRKAVAEVPKDWQEIICNSRTKPSPFIVIDCKREMFVKWGEFLDSKYQKKFSTPTRPIRQLKFTQANVQTVQHRESYTGAYTTTRVTVRETTSKRGKNRRKKILKQLSNTSQLTEPRPAYSGPIPLPPAKYNDLQDLKKFCQPESQEFFTKLPVRTEPVALVAEQEAEDNDFE